MKIVFDTKDGKLTWEMPRGDVQSMKRLGINPNSQAENLKKVMEPTAKIFATLIHVANLGAPGSPQDFTAFLEELDSTVKSLVANYLRLTGNA